MLCVPGLSKDQHISLSSQLVTSAIKTVSLPTKGPSPLSPSIKNIVRIKPSLRRFDTPILQQKTKNKNVPVATNLEPHSDVKHKYQRVSLNRRSQVPVANVRGVRTVKNIPQGWEMDIVLKLFLVSLQTSATQPQDTLKKFQVGVYTSVMFVQ